MKPTGIHVGLTMIIALAWLAEGPDARPGQSSPAQDLAGAFADPPAAARPWAYWFWLNGNITSNGITADLEAMRRVGLGGVLIMEVDQGAPTGPVAFLSPEWRHLFQHVVAEASRLGLEVNMNNDAGWNGSGGPWITPEQSMQKVVWTETGLEGPRHFQGKLSPPEAVAGFYRDIAVLAFPTPGPHRIDRIEAKAGYQVAQVGAVAPTNLPSEMAIDRGQILNLTGQLAENGLLAWEVPAGRWTVLRFGHTSTGVENAPAPGSGRGLECDKLSRAGIEANFAGMMARLVADVRSAAGPTLVATHIDSWENGAQNWTAQMREEFQNRRGYDLLPFLPALTGRVVGSPELSERFLWDLRRTISDLVVENYAGRMRQLAQARGLRFTVEAYGGPCDALPYAGQSDEPMGEFWIGGSALETCRGMASAAHTYGKPIVGAEAFTAGDQERWLEHPATIKALGDRAFCSGINRLVFHRYALQPWRTPRLPGMTMGPWGLHYERTQTWWNWASSWHQYLSRCQFLLRQGRFVADVCYLQAEMPPQGFGSHDPKGYGWDECSAEVVLTRMRVQDGRLFLPDGMSYRLLVLPEIRTMTPRLLRQITKLVEQGATVLGPRPSHSPSLSGYPACDDEVSQLAATLWDSCDGQSVREHRFGHGRVVWGVPIENTLADMDVPPDFTSKPRLRHIHRADHETDLYFVANTQPYPVEARCQFRINGKAPELWWPDTGRIEYAPVWEVIDGLTHLPLRLDPSGSLFVVFRRHAQAPDPFLALTRNGQPLWPPEPARKIVVQKAIYGVLDDPTRTRDVREKVQQIANAGEESFQVSQLAQDGDPAHGVLKSLVVEYTVPGQRIRVTGQDPDTIHLTGYGPEIVVEAARYGVLDDPRRTRDVRAKLQRLVDAGEYSFPVARMAQGDDPAFLVVKTLVVDYTLDGQRLSATGTDPETIWLARPPVPVLERVAEIGRRLDGRGFLDAWQPGQYELKTRVGPARILTVPPLPPPLELDGPWEVSFPPTPGTPQTVTLKKLGSWSEQDDPGIRCFSGTATYRQTFRAPPGMLSPNRRLHLDLGDVQVMAQVKINGRELGTLWKPPFRLDITEAAQPGPNSLEIQIVNLWVNRMIGDEQLPEDSDRHPNGTLKQWPPWLQEDKPSPTGRFTFTTWRLWKKDEPLRPSGLLGPVRLDVAERIGFQE